MASYNLLKISRKLFDSGLTFFTSQELKKLIGESEESTFFSVIKRLTRDGVLEKIERDKYFLKSMSNHDFKTANFLYTPSYISFETALNFHGILSQFPYEITSATPKKTAQKEIHGKNYRYVHIQKSFYWGYYKMDNVLIAEPEKALIDQVYLATKGLKKVDLSEYDLSRIDKVKLNKYLYDYPVTVKRFIK